MYSVQPELVIDPLEPRVLPLDAGSWFVINWPEIPARDYRGEGSQRLRQRPYPLRDLPDVVTALRGHSDYYIGQCVYDRPRRRSVFVHGITHAYVDLDIYTIQDLVGRPPTEIANEVIWHCEDAGLPLPSVIISSGRGLYLKWFFTEPAPRAEVERAREINRALVRGLADFGADPNAVDMARVLRVCGTVNSKNNRRVEIIYLGGTQDDPRTYDFDAFAMEVLPVQHTSDPQSPNRVFRVRQPDSAWFSWADWHWNTVEDIRTLVSRRYLSGKVEQGMRNTFGHLVACGLSHVEPASTLMRELDAVSRDILPLEYVQYELRGHTSSLLQRAKQHADGVRVQFADGKSGSPRYRYTKQHMMDLLKVTADEEPDMKCLISDSEKARRRTKARRLAGVVPRPEYEAPAAARRDAAVALHGQGMSLRAIGRQLGISYQRVSVLLQR